MALNITRKESSAAIWSRRVASFCFQLLILTVILHYLGIINTKTGINLFTLSMIGGGATIIMAFLGLYQVWIYGVKGAGSAVAALVIAAIMLAIPSYFLQKLVVLPAIHDITTDLQNPPEFLRLKEMRAQDANPAFYPGTTTAVEQAESYPDIVPLTLERSKENVFELIETMIEKKLGWKIVSRSAPSRKRAEGIIEAVDKTLIMGFSDDVIIRVTGSGGRSRIDIRSASRYGQHDLGTNAKRIRYFMESIKKNLAVVEATKATRRANSRTRIQKNKNKRRRKIRSKRRRARAARSKRRVKRRAKRARSRVKPKPKPRPRRVRPRRKEPVSLFPF